MKMLTLFFAPIAVSSVLILADTAAAAADSQFETRTEGALNDMRETREVRQVEVNVETQDGIQVVKQDTKEAWNTVKEGSKEAWRDTKSAFSEGVLQGKLSMAISLNKHLKPFKIESDVQGNRAVLTGRVSSQVEKELAGSIAGGIEGIESVDNQLTVDAALAELHRVHQELAQEKAEKRDFSQFFADASTTAAIKTELLANDNIKGLDVNVDTYNGRVTLTGEVKTEAQKSLAEAIAKKRDDVTEVINRISVNS